LRIGNRGFQPAPVKSLLYLSLLYVMVFIAVKSYGRPNATVTSSAVGEADITRLGRIDDAKQQRLLEARQSEIMGISY